MGCIDQIGSSFWKSTSAFHPLTLLAYLVSEVGWNDHSNSPSHILHTYNVYVGGWCYIPWRVCVRTVHVIGLREKLQYQQANHFVPIIVEHLVNRLYSFKKKCFLVSFVILFIFSICTITRSWNGIEIMKSIPFYMFLLIVSLLVINIDNWTACATSLHKWILK